MAVLTAVGFCSVHAQDPSIFVTLSTAQVTSGTTPSAATTTTITAPGSGWNFSAAAPVTGTTWNIIQRPNPLIPTGNNGTNTTGLKAFNSATNIALTSATGTPAAAYLSTWVDVVTLDSSATRTEPSAGAGGNTVLGPNGLMDGAWRVYNGDEVIVHTVSGLTPGRRYYVFFYGSTTSAGQGARFTLNAANVPGGNGTATTFVETRGGNSGNIFVLNGSTYTTSTPAAPNVASTSADTTTWGRLEAVVSGTGTISFRTGKNPTGVNFSNGFQLMPYPLASISIQPPATPVATIGSSVNIAVTASGDGTLSYQWRKNGSAISGNASATTDTLTLTNAQNTDAASYDVIITNPGGSVTSSASVLSITTSAIAPSITAPPVNKTASVGGATSFSITANGTSPLSIQWQKSNDNVSFTNISGAAATVLNIAAAQSSDAGYYRAVVTNSVGSATSSSASLTIAPVLVTSPTSAVVTSGSTQTISVVVNVGAGAPEPTTYLWKRDGTTLTNGSGVSGATTASLQIIGFNAALSGYYTVTAANSAGSVTSSPVYVGVPSTQSITFAPGNNATGIAIDQQLRLIFPSAPKLGTSGTLKIYDASNDSVAATIDVAQFLTYIPGNASATIPNAAIRSVQGASYYYMPIAIYGNEVWVTLSPTQRLVYGKTYYVTMDAALLLDSTNAAYAGVSGSTTWRFSTKSAGPATPTASTGPTTITIAQDGDGDFATFQGAFDWIPQNNTLARTIQVKPGVYRDNASLAQNRNFVTLVGTGANRTDAQLIYPFAYFAPPNSIFTAGSLRIESSDVTVRNLTLDNIIYREYRPTGLTTSGSAAFAGAINTFTTTGNRIVCDNVLIKGGQDTIYNIQGIIYYYNCEVWGSVDFIYGKALAVFDQCNIVQIRSSGGPITAPNTLYGQPYGLVFLNCVFPRALITDGYPYDVAANTTTFQRPWGNDGATAIINCQLGSHFTTKGWAEWDGRENTCRDIEYGSTLIGGGASPTVAQRQAAGAYWLNTIDPDYTSSAMLPTDALLISPGGITNRQPVTVTPANYTVSAIFGHAYFALGGWLPALAPTITAQPLSQTATVGQSITFTVVSTGTPAPAFQWYKNASPISGATASTYTLSSVSTAHAGSYTVVLSNSAGSATSSAAVLTVNAPAVAPSITSQPASQSVNIGSAASFTVTASGDATLTYQWQKDISGTFTNISGATSATLAFSSAQTANAGNYRVVVTNSAGSATSNTVSLAVTFPNFAVTGPDGAAASVTGGGSLTPLVVTTAASFKAAVESSSPAVITISGTLTLSGGKVSVKSNKTIQGADGLAAIIGCLDLGSGGVTNVLIRGLNITNPGTTLDAEGKYTDGGDGISVRDATHVFITHCTLFDCADGMVDINFGSDNVTVSWCEFYYTSAQTNHRFTMIVGSAGAETKPLHITLHHNWWSDRCDQRMPSGTFGYVHLYNNYFTATGNSYTTNARATSQFLIERSIYIGVKDPMYKEGGGLMRAIENVFTATIGQSPDTGTDTVFTPAYSYKLDPTTSSSSRDVATLVLAKSGNTAGLNSESPAVLTASITGPGSSTSLALPTAGSATLTAAFTGFSATSYQWRLNNFPIIGATASTLTLASMDAAKAGAYTVALTLSTGETVISSPFTVTLGNAPAITTQPASVTVTTGAAVSFTVVATGDATLTYQWRKAGTNISGATAATYSIANATTADAAQYSVVVTNAVGSATSSAATLTVNTPPATPPPTSGGGGGSQSLGFVAALALLIALRRRFQHAHANT